ncbi:MAG TPA: hypothetical protein VH092_19700 [Urbifossiella sp.]|jgi:hypothetical protein|nr:hypothetical protein [Urbifossiella sp.]
MGKLAEYVRTEAGRLKAEIDKQAEAVAEWKAAVGRLYAQLQIWTAEADGGYGLLRLRIGRTVSVNDPGLGAYDAEVLTVALGSRTADIVPRARYVAAAIRPPGREPRRADGKVEITDGAAATAFLFRLKGPAGDEWFIRPVWLWNSDPAFGTVEPLDREQFEAVVLGILQ